MLSAPRKATGLYKGFTQAAFLVQRCLSSEAVGVKPAQHKRAKAFESIPGEPLNYIEIFKGVYSQKPHILAAKLAKRFPI